MESVSEEGMLFNKSHRHSALSTFDKRRRGDHLRFRRTRSIGLDRTRVARAFYCDVLHGRQVWDSERAGSLSFIVEGARIDVSTSAASDGEPVVLSVANPDALAERCWDAGYSLRVDQNATGATTMSVIDPFGRRIELVR
jgi:catechol 2,3-dioxygenase-like lactoylglutathione lyase family enzyme